MPPVRETRHLWVGNIPESTTEDKLVEYFQRYGRIDSVKILAKRSSDGGLAAFVDFVDIRCAIKAHETPNRVGDRELRTDYNEPVSSSLSRSHGDQGRRYDRGGRGPGDDGYSSRQSDGYPGNYPYKDDGPARRDYDRAERDGGERDNLRLPEASPDQYHRGSRSAVKRKDSESVQSGSATAVSGSGSESSDSVDSDTESESDSSVSETSKGVKKTTALQIRNLSARPTDATIREGLYHEFKKHGDVGQIKVFGRDSNRHAVVYFRRHEDVVKAIETCRGKMFLGLEMELTPYDDDHYEGSFHRYRRRNEGGGSFGTAEDVYLFNATRTIFVGNIERNTNSSELKRMFERYGEIVDIDIKKQGSNSAYAFIQYLDITHSVEAKKHMNRALMGRNRLKIGFGKGMPTSTVWIGGLGPNVTEQMLERHFQRYGRINRVGLDQQRSYAMISFENIDGSTMAHNDAKDRPVFGKRLRVDYASRESQHFFYDHLARTGQGDGRRYEPSPPPSYRPRGNKNYDDPGMRSRGGMKQANRGSKYHSYDHGYDRGPNFGDGGRGRGHYDEYYRGSGGGGYESDDFGQELREYNVTRERERERERERAREREQDRRQEPLPRRRHYRETGRHELNPDSDGERYYLRGGEHSDVWPGDGGRDRASRESSVEPRDEHRRGDKRRDGDKRRTEDKRAYVKGKYEGHSEDDMELGEKPSTDRKERREKGLRKKPMEARSDKPEFYPSNYEKGSIDGKEKSVSAKRKTKMKDISEGASADEGKLLPEELPSTMESAIEEKVHRSRTEASAEKMTKKVKHKEGKKKRKHKKSPDAIPLDELPPSEIPLGELPPAEVPPENVPPGHIESDGEIQGVGYEPRENTLESRVEKREEMDSEEKKVRKRSNVKSVISERPVLENLEKDRREYRDGRRPRSPSPDDLPGDRVNRKRARSPDRDVERSRVKNAKHVDSIRHSNGNHYDEVKPKRQRESREATPPPPPPPPPPYNARPKPNQHDPRQLPKDEYSVSSSSTDASVPAAPSVVGHSAPSRSSRDIQTFKPQITDTSPSASSGTTKHVTTGQPLAHASPTNSPAAAQTGNGSVPNSDDTLMELLRRHPVMWQGLLGLKNDSAAIQMHYVSGNPKLAEFSLPKASGGTGANGLPIPPVLRIAQRMRMEASQLEGVTKRMQLDKEHCLLLALPCGRDPLDVHAQTRALKNGFIAYLQQKLAAGIINIAQPGSQQASFVLHVFPPCEFTHSHLSRVAPNLLDSATDSGHLMVVVATV